MSIARGGPNFDREEPHTSYLSKSELQKLATANVSFYSLLYGVPSREHRRAELGR